nr:MAG TPA: hypothetical protein [Corticoviridae sp.]
MHISNNLDEWTCFRLKQCESCEDYLKDNFWDPVSICLNCSLEICCAECSINTYGKAIFFA